MRRAISARALVVAALTLASASAAAAPPPSGHSTPAARAWVTIGPVTSSLAPPTQLAHAQQFLEQLARADTRLMVGAPGTAPPQAMPAYRLEAAVFAYDAAHVGIHVQLLSYRTRDVVTEMSGTSHATRTPAPMGADLLELAATQAWLVVAHEIMP